MNWFKKRHKELMEQQDIARMDIHELFDQMDEEKKKQRDEDPVRHFLGSVDLDQIKDPVGNLTESERKQYVAEIATFEQLWTKEILWIVKQQIEFWARNTNNEAQWNFSRGNINMADLLIDKFRLLADEHRQNLITAKEEASGSTEVKPSGAGSELHIF